MSYFKVDKEFIHFCAYVLLAGLLIYFIGMRGTDVGSDTAMYFKYFDFVRYHEPFIGAERVEPGFLLLTKFISLFTGSEKVYLAIIFLIQFIGITSALGKKDTLFKSYLLTTFVWLSFPFFYSITLNVIRQGLAFVFVVYAIDARLDNKKYLPYILLIVGTLLHYPCFLYVVCFLVSEFRPKYTYMLWAWFLSVLLAFLGWLEKITFFLLDLVVGGNSYFSRYLNSSIDPDYATGFKLHFVIVSALPIAYYFVVRKYQSASINRITYIFTLYLTMNIFYLCLVGIPYNDRFAMASWLLIPLMIDYDLVEKVGMLGFFKMAILFSSVIVFSFYVFFL